MLRFLSLLLIVIILMLPTQFTTADQTQTHYILSRPIPAKYSMKQETGFPYGWTRFGKSPIHHGIDFLNRLNTPVLAAAEGEVIFAGQDNQVMLGPKLDFYGNAVVIKHDPTAPDGSALFTLYGHLNEIQVQQGTRVSREQQIGNVGKTGIALWYHLHFEVRVGNAMDYNAVRNPELWLAPLPGTGKIIGRMVDANGGLAMGIRMTITTATSVIPNFTYAEGTMPSDPLYNENFVVPDLRAGCYRLRVKGRGKYIYDEAFCIKDGETKIMMVQLSN